MQGRAMPKVWSMLWLVWMLEVLAGQSESVYDGRHFA